MGSAQSVAEAPPQQELPPPATTRRAAWPYFCLTVSLMSCVGVIVR